MTRLGSCGFILVGVLAISGNALCEPPPSWVNDGVQASFPQERSLCVVGEAKSREPGVAPPGASVSRQPSSPESPARLQEAATIHARGRLRQLLVQPPINRDGIHQPDTTIADDLVSLAEQEDTWSGEDRACVFLCLERAPAAAGLLQKLALLDDQVREAAAAAAKAKGWDRYVSLSRAAKAVVDRRALVALLGVVDPEQSVPPFPVGDEALAVFAAARSDWAFAVRVEGEGARELQTALIAALTQVGFTVVEKEKDAEFVVDGVVKLSDAGRGSGAARDLWFADAQLVARVLRPKDKRVIGAISRNKHRAHRNLSEAKRGALRALARLLARDAAREIESMLRRL